MGLYSYKARNNAGQLVMGSLEATSEQDVITQLRQLQYTPVKISQGGAANGKTTAKAEPRRVSPMKVKIRDLTTFCTNLSSMTDAGIPLLDGLNMSSVQLENPYLVDVIRKVGVSVSEGASLSESLSVYPKVFSNFFVNMVRVGELSGTLDSVLRELAVYLERQETLKQTIRGMFIYPCILMTAGIGVVILILTFVMPQFVAIFLKAKVPLPGPTQFLYALGLWMKKYWYILIGSIIATVIGSRLFLKTEVGKNTWDTLLLKIPVVGSLMKKVLIVRFSHTLGAMLDAGVPLMQSLKIVRQVVGNKVFVDIVEEIYTSVEKGEGIHTPLLARVEFPRDVTHMISVGEKTGNIGKILHKISNFYENKVQLELKDMVVLIEPTFIVVMGGAIGFILASMILPMFDMVKTIHR